MPFLEGFNQAFFPVLLQYLQQQRQMNERQQALEGLQQELTTTETIPAPTAQVPGTARSGFNPMTGGGTRLSALPMTISGVPTQEQRQIGFDDPRAIQPLLNYYSQIGEPVGLNALMSLFQAQQPKFREIGAGTTYGSEKGGVFTPQGTTEFRPSMPTNQTTWRAKSKSSGGFETYQVPGTDDVRIIEQEVNSVTGQPTGNERLATGGAPPSPYANARIGINYKNQFDKDWRVQVYKEANYSRDAAIKAYKAATKPGANRISADQALVTVLNKLLDPKSVVRESEFARTPEGAALVNRLQGWVESWTQGGQKFTDQDRTAIINTINDLHSTAQQGYLQARGDYSQMAKNVGLIPFNIIGSEIKPFEKLEDGTIHFREGNEEWDIPADKIEKFKQLHPKAVQQ